MKRVLAFLILITLIGGLVQFAVYAEEPIALEDFDDPEEYADAVVAQTIKELEEAAKRGERDDLVVFISYIYLTSIIFLVSANPPAFNI